MNFFVSGDKVFYTLQGEGVTIGSPAVFIRLHFCNLRCNFCDTPYTWKDDKEKEEWSVEKMAEEIKKADVGNSLRLIITGGEPMVQQRQIIELLKLIPEYKVEIESNGTIPPPPELWHCQFNCSPKLSNSGDHEGRRRFVPETLEIINKIENSYFKFVVREPKDLEEIEREYAPHIDKSKIILMPEGVTMEDNLKHMQAVAEIAKEKSLRVIPRLQIIIWGNKRKV
jgi:organic radical activating enzyme